MSGQPISVKAIKDCLAQKSLAPRKSLGQNFLSDRNILDKIVKTAEITDKDLVLEIGPGLGSLTERLLMAAEYVVAVEYDRGLYSILTETLQSPKLQLVNADFMQLDLDNLLNDFQKQNWRKKVVANLPYYITSPIIFKLLESRIIWEQMVFLVQKEVAQRIIAKPGTKEYGALTVMINYFGKAEMAGTVPKTVFYPAPQVDSAIVKITLEKRQSDSVIYPYLQRVVQAAFGQRRKTLLNALGSLESCFGSKEELARVLLQENIDSKQRGETLGINEFLKIASELQRRCPGSE